MPQNWDPSAGHSSPDAMFSYKTILVKTRMTAQSKKNKYSLIKVWIFHCFIISERSYIKAQNYLVVLQFFRVIYTLLLW